MREEGLFAILIGLVIMFATFELMGGTAYAATQDATFVPFLKPIQLWSALMGGVAAIITAVVSWLKNSIKITLAEFGRSNEEQHGQIFVKLNQVEEKVDVLADVSDTQKRYRKELLRIQDEWCNLFDERTDITGQAKSFALIQSKSFREFAMGMQETGVDVSSLSGLKDSAMSAVETVEKSGIEIFGRDFMDYYHPSHVGLSIKYLQGISQVIQDPDNSKLERIHDHNKRFLISILRNLQISWIAFNTSTHRDDIVK